MNFWTNFTYQTGWSAGSLTGGAVGAYKVDGDRVSFRGTVVQSGLSGNFPFVIAVLDSRCCPNRRVYLAVACAGPATSGAVVQPSLISIDTSGNLNFEGPTLPGGSTPDLCLDGISYSIVGP